MPRNTPKNAVPAVTRKHTPKTRRHPGGRPRKGGNPSIPGEPSYRLHKRSRQAVVTLSGRDVYLGEYGTPASRERYRAAVAEWIARGRRPAEPEGAKLSVAELLLAYLEYAEGYYRTRDGQPNERELWHVRRPIRVLRELFGATPAAEFGPNKLRTVRDRLVADGLCRGTCNKYTRRIVHAFKWAAGRELIGPAVWQSLAALDGLRRGHTPARETEPVRPVPDALVDAIRPHVSRQVWGLIELQRYSGCRPGEAVIIRGIDLDMSGPLWMYRPAFHKTECHGHERVIMLGPKAQAVLRPFLKADTQAYLFSPDEADAERRAALTAARVTPASCGNKPGTNRKRRPRKQPGERYTVGSYRRAIADACGKAFPVPDGLTDDERRAWRHDHQWHPNQLRHTFGTRVRSEFGLDAAQVALGHTEAKITQVYAERDQKLAAQVALRIG